MTIRVTHIEPSTRITQRVLDPVFSQLAEVDVRVTQTLFQSRVRVVEPTVTVNVVRVQERRTIEQVSDDLQLLANQTGYVFTNRGATIDVTCTLPPSSSLVGGEVFRFRSATPPHYLRVATSGSDVIGLDKKYLFYVRSQQERACIELEYQGGGVFFVPQPEIGLWLLDE